jgi:spore coat protein U-like protein
VTRPSPARLLAASLAALALPAAAATCAVTVPGFAFGNYDALSPAPTDSSTVLQVECQWTGAPASETVAYTVALSTGTGTFAARTMLGGTHALQYNLYTSPAIGPATVWGDGTGGSMLVAGALGPLSASVPVLVANHPIHGRIPARQDVPVGSYGASVLVTLTY